LKIFKIAIKVDDGNKIKIIVQKQLNLCMDFKYGGCPNYRGIKNPPRLSVVGCAVEGVGG